MTVEDEVHSSKVDYTISDDSTTPDVKTSLYHDDLISRTPEPTTEITIKNDKNGALTETDQDMENHDNETPKAKKDTAEEISTVGDNTTAGRHCLICLGWLKVQMKI